MHFLSCPIHFRRKIGHFRDKLHHQLMRTSFSRAFQGSRVFPLIQAASDPRLQPPTSSQVCSPSVISQLYCPLHQDGKTTRFTFPILVLCPLEIYPYVLPLPSVSKENIKRPHLRDLPYLLQNTGPSMISVPLNSSFFLYTSPFLLPQQTSSSSRPRVYGQPWLIHSPC